MHSVPGRASVILIFAVCMVLTVAAPAQIALTQLSSDTFTDQPSQHATEVEPGAFSYGSTIVTAFQVARIFSGGGADIGFATSKDGGVSWTNGYLPGITIYQGNGTYDAASDAAVAYDAMHGVWLISTLPISNVNSNAVATSRSTDGLSWSGPSFVTTQGNPDKNWIVCDNTATSPFYGHCYSEWDDGGQILMSTSTDGGLTWGPAKTTAGNDSGIGGVPLVQPGGKVIVPIAGFNGDMIAFSSTNGGQSWTKAVKIATAPSHAEDGGIRSAGLPSSAIDANGKVYVAWSDCRFRTACAENDIVFSTSAKGTSWSKVNRIPIDPTSSTVDHFITGMAIAPGTKGTTTKITLAYYYYPVSACGNSCQLYVGAIQSSNAGKTWTPAQTLAGPMNVQNWLPDTFSGFMVADYISVGYGNGKAYPVFAVAHAKNGSLFQQAIYTTATGLAEAGPEVEQLSSAGDRPVPNAHSDHGPMEFYDQEHRFPIKGHRPPESSE
ncbi:MAG: sialidase family protein [Terriglobales bacterium]